jgi:hypothetical protein
VATLRDLTVACGQNEAAQTLSASAFIRCRKQLTYRSNPPLPEAQFNLKRKDNLRVIPFRLSKKTTIPRILPPTDPQPAKMCSQCCLCMVHHPQKEEGERLTLFIQRSREYQSVQCSHPLTHSQSCETEGGQLNQE